MEATVVLGFVSLVFILYAILRHISSKNVPSGPTGLPIVGYIPYMGDKPYLVLEKLAKTYGNIFSLRMGSEFVVVLNDFDSAKEAFGMDDFMGRPKALPFPFNKDTYDTNAFFGMLWKEQRRFCLHMLRDLGLGRSKMEEHMREEIIETLEDLESEESKPVQITRVFAPSMSNNICSMVFGKRFKHNDPMRRRMDYWVTETINGADQVGWQLFFPWLNKMMKSLGLGKYKQLSKVYKEMKDYVRMEVAEHEKTLDPNNVRDFIDGYLLEIKKRKDNPTFIKTVLEDMVSMFFVAGSETVRVTLEWLLLTVATHKDVQRKIQGEIDEVLGRSGFPTYTDHKQMPYTDAVINELNRWMTIVPLNVLRLTLSDTRLKGYFIPKDTIIVSNLWAVHNDVEYWGNDVREFRPERFLSDDGKSSKKVERLIPFSIGKRACPGEPMAKMEVFVYFVAILQKFDVSLPKGKVANFEGRLGATLQPYPQELVFTKRN